MKVILLLLAALLFMPPSVPAWAQPAAAEQSAGRDAQARRAGQGGGERAAAEARRLPPDSVTHHVLELPGRTLRFTARAGSLPLVDPQGALQAEIAFVAYTLDEADAGVRPVTFAVNGGPGAASAYLHLGVLGPWRLPLDGPVISPSAPPALVANPETWLDFTDLVFLDPVETGYSRAPGSAEEVRNRFFTIDGDLASLAAAIARWLRMQDRLASPKFFMGESYGGFRGPQLARKLQSDHGVGLSGLVLLSPVLDFAGFGQGRHNPWGHVTRLPSFVAAAREGRGTVSRQSLRDVEAYARTDFLTDLVRGLKDREAVERVSAKVAALTGLDPALVRREAGRLDTATVQRELRRDEDRVVSAYDTGVSSYDPDPISPWSEFGDPVLATMTAPLTSAIVDLLARRLNWRVPDQRYELLNGAVNGKWRWGGGRRAPEAFSDLRRVLALDPSLRVLIAHGFTDLVTPYFANALLLDQLPEFGPDRRVQLAVYPGGHMFYSRDGSRRSFRDDAVGLYEAALKARAAGPAGP